MVTGRDIEAAAAVEGWHRLAAQIAAPDVELTVEEFADVWTAYECLRRYKVPVDPMLAAILAKLADQAFSTDDGLDDDETEHEADVDSERFDDAFALPLHSQPLGGAA